MDKFIISLCFVVSALAQDCYKFILYDEVGDGWIGNYYVFITDDDTVVASGTLLQGTSQVDIICLENGCYRLGMGGNRHETEKPCQCRGLCGKTQPR